MMMRALLRTSCAILALAWATPVFAQRSEGPSPLRGDTAIRTASVARRVLAPIVFEAEPRSFQIVRVPIPVLLSGAQGVVYEIEPAGAFSVLGARRGRLIGSSAQNDLLITVRIPADAQAGSHMAAHAIFRLGVMEIEVPIETRVKSVYRIELDAGPVVSHINVGERVEVLAVVRNLGNATDTIRVSFETPAQWQQQVRDTVVVVPAGGSARKLARVIVPKTSSTGSFFIRTTAASRGGLASTTSTLSVGSRPADLAPPGPTARFAMGAVGIEGGASVGVAQIAVSGPLTSSIHIDGRLATRPATNAAGIRGLSRVGAYVTEPHFAAWTSTWRLGLGSTVTNTNELTGVNAGGRGISFALDDQSQIVNFTASRPVMGGLDEPGGSFLSANYARRFSGATVGGTISRLRDTGFGHQSLTAAGLHAKGSLGGDINLEGGLAYRDYETGSGMGWIVGVSGDLPRTRAEIRLTQAPGGTRAFARAESEIIASALTQVSKRTEVITSMLRATNTDAAHNEVRSNQLSVASSYRLTDQNTIRAEIRTSQFDIDGTPFSFSNGQLHFGVGGSFMYKGVSYSSDVGIDQLTRGVQTPQLNAEDTGERISWRVRAGRALWSGVAQLEGSYERADRKTGFIPEQHSLTARLENVQLPHLPQTFSFDAEVGYNRWTEIRSFASWRAAANYQLPAAMEVSASLEHNPLVYTGTNTTPIVFAVRLEKSFGLPRMNVGRASGIIFQDYDGNGSRDVDEPGMPNIRVRRGDARAVSDGDGHYRFWQEGRGATSVEAATIPYGWIVGNVVDGNIALVPTTRVEITLQLGLAERMRNLDISQLAITARDDAGRVWFARRTDRELAVFEALPVGIYELGVDAALLAEPLRIDGTPKILRLTREPVTRVTLPLIGRPLRFKQQGTQ